MFTELLNWIGQNLFESVKSFLRVLILDFSLLNVKVPKKYGTIIVVEWN